MVVDGCEWLERVGMVVVDGCKLLWMVGGRERLVGIGCGRLCMILCGWLWIVVDSCGWLAMVVSVYGWLWMVVDG